MTIQQSLDNAIKHHLDGRLREAEAGYREILRLDPNHPETTHLLGVIAYQVGQYQIAFDLISKAIALKSTVPAFHNNMARTLIALDRKPEAISHFRRAIELQSNYGEAHLGLLQLLVELNKSDEAVAHGEQCVALFPNDANMRLEYSNALSDVGRDEQAIAQLHEALRINPNYAAVYSNLGRHAQSLNCTDEAIAYYEKAIQCNPGIAEAHMNLALALMSKGDFKRGFDEYEWRWKCPGWWGAHQKMSQPTWDGSIMRDKSMLLHAEQGYGDTFQLIRYAPMIAQRVGKVILGCRPEIRSLLERVPGIHEMLIVGGQIPTFDMQINLASVPRVFGTTIDTIPQTVPYLFADEARKAHWGRRLGDRNGKFRVGIVWKGQALPDPKRSTSLEEMAVLGEIDGVEFFSLQKGEGVDEARRGIGRKPILDFTSELTDFSETAALIANLDLTISIDTSVAHLCGALGVPVLTALTFSASYQWLQEREDSPWYPTMKLFRQARIGDWREVFVRVALEVQNRKTAGS